MASLTQSGSRLAKAQADVQATELAQRAAAAEITQLDASINGIWGLT